MGLAIQIINGPNLNMLGERQPEIYGNQSFESYYNELRNKYPKVKLEYFQSNHEGRLVDKIQEVGFSSDGIIINPAGLTHTSVTLADALRSIQTRVVEVHISNIFNREEYRKTSLTASACVGSISGLGLTGYELAIEYFLRVH